MLVAGVPFLPNMILAVVAWRMSLGQELCLGRHNLYLQKHPRIQGAQMCPEVNVVSLM